MQEITEFKPELARNAVNVSYLNNFAKEMV